MYILKKYEIIIQIMKNYPRIHKENGFNMVIE